MFSIIYKKLNSFFVYILYITEAQFTLRVLVRHG